MIRSALLVAAAILAAATAACTPPPPAPPPPTPIAAAATCPDGTSFLKSVSYLTTPFSPAPGLPLPPSGPLPAPGPGVPDYAGALAAAFNAASPAFQKTLCSLDAVFVNAVPCASPAACLASSWGWWQSRPTTPHGRVVALSAGLWNEPDYSHYETDLTQSLLPTSGVAYAGAQSCSAAGVCRPIDDLATALLAALAHEVGHIAWYVVVPQAQPASFCGGKFFTGWRAGSVTPPPRWRELLTLPARDNIRHGNGGKWPYIHSQPPQLDSIDHPGPGGPGTNSLIYSLLAPSQPWASLFATISPDEDFVETYKFAVLTTANPPLTAVTITVPGAGAADIVQDYLVPGRKPSLVTKVGCVPVAF